VRYLLRVMQYGKRGVVKYVLPGFPDTQRVVDIFRGVEYLFIQISHSLEKFSPEKPAGRDCGFNRMLFLKGKVFIKIVILGADSKNNSGDFH